MCCAKVIPALLKYQNPVSGRRRTPASESAVAGVHCGSSDSQPGLRKGDSDTLPGLAVAHKDR